MAKLLKLVGIQTFCGPMTNSTPVAKGEVAQFNEEVAAYLLKGAERHSVDDADVPHWQEVEGVEPQWDFEGLNLPTAVSNHRVGGSVPKKPQIGEEAGGEDEAGSEQAAPTAQRKARVGGTARK